MRLTTIISESNYKQDATKVLMAKVFNGQDHHSQS